MQCFAAAAALLVAFEFGNMQTFSIPADAAKTAIQIATIPPTGAAPKNVKAGDALNLWVRDHGGRMP